jgi:hypothetical protein
VTLMFRQVHNDCKLLVLNMKPSGRLRPQVGDGCPKACSPSKDKNLGL